MQIESAGARRADRLARCAQLGGAWGCGGTRHDCNACSRVGRIADGTASLRSGAARVVDELVALVAVLVRVGVLNGRGFADIEPASLRFGRFTESRGP
jgi:hypothetical protein